MQYEVPPSATAGEAAELRKTNGMSCCDARKRQNAQKNQKKHPVNHSLSAHCVRVLAKVGRFLAQSDVKRKKHFLRKSAKLSYLLWNKILETKGR